MKPPSDDWSKLTPAERNVLVMMANAKLIAHDYHIMCFDCVRFKPKPFGPNKLLAQATAIRHKNRKPGHTVFLRDYGVPVQKFHRDIPEPIEGIPF